MLIPNRRERIARANAARSPEARLVFASRLQQMADNLRQKQAETAMAEITFTDTVFRAEGDHGQQTFDNMQQRVTEALTPHSALGARAYKIICDSFATKQGKTIYDQARDNMMAKRAGPEITDSHHLVGTADAGATPFDIAEIVVAQWRYPESRSGVVLPIDKGYEVRWSRRVSHTAVWATRRTGWQDSDKRTDGYFHPSVKATDALEVYAGVLVHIDAACRKLHPQDQPAGYTGKVYL